MVKRMLADPDLHGYPLLFAIALADVVTSGLGSKDTWMTEVCERLGCQRDWVKVMVAQDRPRYEPRREYPLTCRGQMIRRAGLCGKAGHHVGWLYDDEGRREEIGACSRHRDQVNASCDASRRAWVDAGKPIPPANTGGILEKYFSADWDRIYAWSSYRWERPPAGVVRTDMRPVLRLIVGGLDSA